MLENLKIDLLESRYTTPEVLSITRLRKDVLQTWINREIIQLGEQNPGSGKRRLYRAIDIIKLAVMRRMADLNIALSVSTGIAKATESRLLAGKTMEWDFYLILRPKDATQSIGELISSGDALTLFNPTVGDPYYMRVSELVEVFDGVFSRRERPSLDDIVKRGVSSESRPINPLKRDALARQGIHAEPAIIFPLGEIVNGALLQILSLDQSEA